MQNRSKFVQLTSTILLEYIINESDYSNDTIDNNIFNISERKPIILDTKYKNATMDVARLYSECVNDNMTLNSVFDNVVPMDIDNRKWFLPIDDQYNYINLLSKYCSNYKIFNDVDNVKVRYDVIRLHILSGYSFDDIFGFMLQIRTFDNDHNIIKLCNKLFKRSSNKYTFEKPIIIDNKVYDKYLEIKIPSTRDLRSNIDTDSSFINELIGENYLNILNSKTIENVEIIYSNILKSTLEEVYDDKQLLTGYSFRLDNNITVELPYESESDKFNIYIEESSSGNYINFCCTWDNSPITASTINSLNTRIKLYSANGSQNEDILDNLYYADNTDINKWIIYHEIVTSCYKNNVLVENPQTHTVHQTFENVNIYSPVIFKYMPILNNNSDIDFITFEYTARLLNRYDGTQIVRKGGLTSYNKQRYIPSLHTITNKNITNFNVFNKINRISEITTNSTSTINTKYIKEYVNCNNIILDSGISNIRLNKYGGTYMFKLIKVNEDGVQETLDLSNAASYVIMFKDENNKINEINCTYSNNMNILHGQLEFNINLSNATKMLNAPIKTFAIKSKNIDGSSSTLIELNYNFNN